MYRKQAGRVEQKCEALLATDGPLLPHFAAGPDVNAAQPRAQQATGVCGAEV